jgi:hypothetical protein
MARTPLANLLQGAVGTLAEASARRIPVGRVLAERRRTRREFVRDAGAVGAAATGLASLNRGVVTGERAASEILADLK